jgi:hypothetical protein
MIKNRRFILAGALALAGVCLGAVLAHAEPEKKADPKAAPKKLTGAELYAMNCNRCHPERYATEFTTAQWQTIMLHMRVRANLPAAQAKEILKFLKEDAGN